MREIRYSTAFKRDFKREKKGQHRNEVSALLSDVLLMLVDDKPLPAANRDHPLIGERSGYRDCHLKPDLLLIYGKPDAKTLDLARLGSHSELFG